MQIMLTRNMTKRLPLVGNGRGAVHSITLTPTYQHKIGFTRSIFLCRGQQRYARSAFRLGRGEHDANPFLFGTGILF